MPLRIPPPRVLSGGRTISKVSAPAAAIGESAVICDYIEDVHTQKPGLPKDPLERARSRLHDGPSLPNCEECGEAIPEARRVALPGVRLCLPCQDERDRTQTASGLYNRRGSKDSQLR